MFDAARKDGIYPVVREGYWTYEEQQKILDDKIKAYINEGYSQSRAERTAKEWVALPGTSEHQLGIAVDINADKSKSSNDEVYTWLALLPEICLDLNNIISFNWITEAWKTDRFQEKLKVSGLSLYLKVIVSDGFQNRWIRCIWECRSSDDEFIYGCFAWSTESICRRGRKSQSKKWWIVVFVSHL